MAEPLTIAVIAAGSALLGTSVSQVGAYFLERMRFRNATRVQRVDDARSTVEAAATAYVQARMALDNALNGNTDRIDSVPLFTALLEHWSRITLRLGSSHAIASSYREAIDSWAAAIGTAAQAPSPERDEQLASLRNAAEAAYYRFLDESAPYVGPEADPKSKRKQLAAPLDPPISET